ncbi:MAG: TetR/AcrR family transcriptional regulator [Mycobacteriaceae bacterium]|nr:TetR/AcrR family transcriptional regulator [Mycobacteriaceae bacterium]
MLSISNDVPGAGESVDLGDRILAAADSCVRDFGAHRVTLAEIARRAGVSRPTVYRRWPDTRAILAALLTRRIVAAWDAAWAEAPAEGVSRVALVERIVDVAARLRDDELIVTVLRSAPDLAMVYIADRLGTSQQILINMVAEQLRKAQADNTVRSGDPRQLATMALLITQSVIQSAQIVSPILDGNALNAELSRALNGYLRP